MTNLIYITLTDGVIVSKYQNITVSKGMSFTLSCISRCKLDFCQVMWTTNKTSAFVKNDNEHTVWSTQPSIIDAQVQTHHLTVNHPSNSTSHNYQCLLITIAGKIVDSAEQRVYVTEPGR